MKISEQFTYSKNSLKGVVGLRVTDRNGNVILEDENHNLIVNGGYKSAARSIGGDENYIITQIAVGSSGTAPMVTDVLPLATQFKKNVASVSYPADNEVQFNWFLDFSEANGIFIREFGLVTFNNTLFSRRVRTSAIEKTNELRIDGYWKIIF